MSPDGYSQKIVVRHDDFDFRLELEDYRKVHEQFVAHGIVETAVLQFCKSERVTRIKPEIVEYMNTSPYWDIQLHGWDHFAYDTMTYDEIYRDLAASKYLMKKYFDREPTVWYPPRNCWSEQMMRAAGDLGMTVDNESYDINKFIREADAGVYQGHSLYFHAWMRQEREAVPQMLGLVKLYADR